MREDICTIPVSEGFENPEGCPLCRMRNMAEARAVEYIMGPAMMEPDIRIMTNKKGFCHRHLSQMKKAKNRLSLALILDSHLKELEENVFASNKFFKPSAKKTAKRAEESQSSCFICDTLEHNLSQMIKTVCITYSKDKDFRRLFNEQEYFCLPHLAELISASEQFMEKDRAHDMVKEAKEMTLRYMKQLNGDVRHFCDMFDYRNGGEDADWGNSRDSIERAILFLTGRGAE